ncbi:MAG: hypothetical protein IPF85_22035 [Anaerolineae bacterium]|nr:hypothetical protein [Anaerolineae bacterium]
MGLDAGKFNECLDSGQMEAKVQDGLDLGQQAQVRGTPNFFLIKDGQEPASWRAALRAVRPGPDRDSNRCSARPRRRRPQSHSDGSPPASRYNKMLSSTPSPSPVGGGERARRGNGSALLPPSPLRMTERRRGRGLRRGLRTARNELHPHPNPTNTNLCHRRFRPAALRHLHDDADAGGRRAERDDRRHSPGRCRQPTRLLRGGASQAPEGWRRRLDERGAGQGDQDHFGPAGASAAQPALQGHLHAAHPWPRRWPRSARCSSIAGRPGPH